MPAHRVHANAETPVRSRVGRARTTPRPTGYALRREGTHRRRRQPTGPIEGAAREPPSRRATPSAAHGAMPRRRFQCPRTRLHTDSCSDSSSLASHRATAAFGVIRRTDRECRSARLARLTRGRRGERCRCGEASARIQATGRDLDRCDSRHRHRPDEGWCRTRG